MEDILLSRPGAKVVSTQAPVQGLFAPRGNVVDAPDKHYLLKAYLKQGFEFLVVEPQAFVSLTADGKRFSKDLEGYLAFIVNSIRPIKEYPHFHSSLLERFVFEHSQDLKRSIEFLRGNSDGRLGTLKVYDLRQCVSAIDQGIQIQKALRGRLPGHELIN